MNGEASMNDAAMSEATIQPAIAREAARWLMRLNDEPVSETDRAGCLAWRASHPDHERAWQRAEQFGQRLGLIPQRIAMPTLDRSSTLDRRSALKALSILIAAGLTTYVGWRAEPWQVWMADAQTPTGEIRTLTLADGSTLTLNTASAVDIAFNEHTRLIRLHAGEIHIETAPDPAPVHRPLVVQTPNGRMTALGTRFVVRLERGLIETRTHLAVLEGAVEIRPDAAAHVVQVLHAGEQTDFDAQTEAVPMPVSAQADGWVKGILYAQEMRLGDLLDELGRYRTGVLRCDPAVADLRISGAFQLKSPDDVLDLLQKSLPLRVTYRTRYWVMVGPV